MDGFKEINVHPNVKLAYFDISKMYTSVPMVQLKHVTKNIFD